MISLAIRLIGSAILLYFVYGETGWATTTVLALIILSNEMTVFILNTIFFRRMGGFR